MPKVSVVIPVYNVEKYLGQCLDSVIHQTFQNLEIICIDDCSSDNSKAILDNYMNTDNRIKVIKNENNLGAALSRNKGLERAGGEYIYFMDSDDYLNKNYIGELVFYIEEKACDVVFNSKITYLKDGKLEQLFEYQVKDIDENGCYKTTLQDILALPCMAWCRLYRKSFLDTYNLKWLDVKVANDYVFHYITQVYLDKVFVYKGEDYFYRYREEGLSQKNKFGRFIDSINMIFDFYRSRNLLDKFNMDYFRLNANLVIKNEEIYVKFKIFLQKLLEYAKIDAISTGKFNYFVLEAILTTKDYQDFLTKYSPVIFCSFLRENYKKTRRE